MNSNDTQIQTDTRSMYFHMLLWMPAHGKFNCWYRFLLRLRNSIVFGVFGQTHYVRTTMRHQQFLISTMIVWRDRHSFVWLMLFIRFFAVFCLLSICLFWCFRLSIIKIVSDTFSYRCAGGLFNFRSLFCSCAAASASFTIIAHRSIKRTKWPKWKSTNTVSFVIQLWWYVYYVSRCIVWIEWHLIGIDCVRFDNLAKFDD